MTDRKMVKQETLGYTGDISALRPGRCGIDTSLIESNMLLTPQERLRRNDRVLTTAEKMRTAMERKHSG